MKYYIIPRYRYVDVSLRSRYDSTGVDFNLPAAADSVFHYGDLTLRWHQVHYATFVRLNRFRKPEDVNLGLDSRVTAGVASGSRVDYRFYSFWPQLTLKFGPALMTGGFRYREWRAEGDPVRHTTNCYFKSYLRYTSHQTLVIAAGYVSDRLASQTPTLYLDETSGLRGYPLYAYSGENRLIINVENRFFSDLEILSVGIGAVAFADIGNIWARDRALSLRDTRTSFGAGMRFGISRSTQAEIIRIDIAYAPGRDLWEISMGTGQFF